jgi:hypothetical protein
MTPFAVFLHTMLILTLGPLVAGLTHWGAVGAPQDVRPSFARINAGLKAPGNASLLPLVTLAGATVAGLLLPLFSADSVLGFLGDGFVVLGLLVGLTVRGGPLPVSSVLTCATALWVLGTLTGSTDLGQALSHWEPGLGSGLLFVGLALGVAPLMAPIPASGDGLDDALELWARSTLQLVWLALAAMVFPWQVPVTNWGTLGLAIAASLLKLATLAWGLAFITQRWPRVPFGWFGLAVSIGALSLVKLGV